MIDLPPFPTGFHAFWADVRQFLAAVQFARPGLLWLALVPVVFSVVAYVASRRQRNAIAQVGRPAAVFGLLTRQARPSRPARLALLLAWHLASISLAGAALYSLGLLWSYRRSHDPIWRPFIEGQGFFAACLAGFIV